MPAPSMLPSPAQRQSQSRKSILHFSGHVIMSLDENQADLTTLCALLPLRSTRRFPGLLQYAGAH